MIDFSELSLETFQVLRAYGKEIVLYDENGNRVFEPADARRFYLSNDNILVSILEDGDNSAIKMYLSANIQISEVLEFITVLRRIATQFNVLFNVRKYNMKITPRDFATQAAVQEQKEYSMNIMEGLYGTSKSSYLKLENARMIVRHSARVKENMIGGRGRAIQSIFVENAKGERFLFPVNVLSGARAMTQHVNHGGTFADAVGQQIIRMAQDFSNLSTVATHIGANQKSLAPQALGLRESVKTKAMEIRRTFERLCRDESSYVRESARITEAESLNESPENIAETVDVIRALLAVEGVKLENSVLETVAKHVGFMEDMRPEANAPDNTQDPDDGQQVKPVQPTKPVGSDDNNDDDDNNGNSTTDNQSGSFHEDVAETKAIQAFNAWMEEFDPDYFFAEGKSYKRNDDDDESADDKKKKDKQKRDDKRSKNDRPVEEGKSYKRNDDDDDESAAEKKKKDQEKRDAAKNKKQRTDEGLIDQASDDFEADEDWVYDNQDQIIAEIDQLVAACSANPALLASLGEKIKKGVRLLSMAGFEPMDFLDPEGEVANALGLFEGKSYKRNRDEDADDKKKQDKKRRDDQKGKNEPVEEGKSFKRNKDEDADDKKKQDKQKRDNQKGKQERTDEGIRVFGLIAETKAPFSKKFATIAERDAWTTRNTGSIVIHGTTDGLEEGKSFKRNKDEDADDKKKQDKQKREDKRGKQERTDEADGARKPGYYLHDAYDKVCAGPFRTADIARQSKSDADDVVSYWSGSKWVDQMDEASDIGFNDAKQQYQHTKRELAKMSPFDPKYIRTKAHLDKLQDRLHRADADDLDEASDISFNDAKDEIRDVKQKLKSMSPFDKSYVSTKARLHKLEDRLARNGDDEVDEAMGGPGYVNASGVNTDASACNEDEMDEAEGTESSETVLPEGLGRAVVSALRSEFGSTYYGASMDQGNLIVDLDEYDNEDPMDVQGVINQVTLGYDIRATYVSETRGRYVFSLAKVQEESYVSGDGGYDGDSSDVIEDLNMEDFVMPRNMSKSLADEVEKHDDENGEPEDQAYISRLRTLAGMNKI
jgi:hypothetical protein